MSNKQGNNNHKRISGFRKGTDVLQGVQKGEQQKTTLLKGHWLNVALLLVLYDLAVVNFSYVAALWLRYDFRFSTINPVYLKAWISFAPIYSVFCLFVFWRTKLYNSIWRYASYTELLYMLEATALTAVFHIFFITILFQRMPISYYIMGPTLQFMFMTMVRFSYRFILLLRSERLSSNTNGRVMTIGAGNAGQSCNILDICKEISYKLWELPDMYRFTLGNITVCKAEKVSV